MRTPLTYYGGKQRIAAVIVERFGHHRVYVEPFAGGAAVLFAKPRSEREVLNDLDGAVTAFWRIVRDAPDQLAAAIECTPYGREEWQACKQGLDEQLIGDLERARRLFVTIDQSYARCGDTWSPPSKLGDRPGRWQPLTWAKRPAQIVAAAERLRGVAIENVDACSLVESWDRPDVVIYCDPPYTGPGRRRGPGASAGGKRGYRHDVEPTLWPRLTEQLLAVRHATVALSGYPCDETRELELAGWQPISIDANRASANRPGSAGGKTPETLWLSPACPAALAA